ncbi:MAG: DUF447 domain-containing protein [Gammaproteobacteria bacterium]
MQIAPMGVRLRDDQIIIAPFRPSTTLENLMRSGAAVINLTDDVRIFAGCLTGRYDWPTVPATVIQGRRLQDPLSHIEVEIMRMEEDETRPRFFCAVRHRGTHRPFPGFNRAQHAVLEAAILVSRLHLLPAEKIDAEIKYLQIAVDKTAGDAEREAWDWLLVRINEHHKQQTPRETLA